ncbi:Heh2p SKDI_04G6600 [Saccharomyces kudriavzevii IFO 1802]|uniref:HEH2-like protein n=2 Tax=Saccharomyces kudriavzevii (strain ATCC MYA-4449 / AS 2.2408 / CBS 8840 / NBRC 1802 / NCYC 2889) TaxID=226230 RepID=J8TXT9_SACK1|nr:uncharacterized protein SKDI_04G6600 [Saccharomyces kudriavzevii IFO 1802]EJT44944.1 HEH2-like protein [Saccharomyces kudriavzevii IFO 1802]CAI4059356.1 hypothetical protein SKDI_04G6600 [Saccharomyces kudriavzevii IFO 1802]
MEHKGLDPKTLKVSQLRRILVENDITFPANARKPALVKLFEERVRQRLELSSETSKGNDSIQKAVKSEAKNADRKRILKSKKHESNSGASKSVNVETNKRKREENSTDNTIPVQVKEEKSSKRKRKKRSNRTTKSLESPSKPKLESEEPSVTLSPEMEIREEHKEEFSNGELIATEESKKPELPNLKVSNEFLVQLNKELASATTESYDHSIKSTNCSSVRIEREEPVETATGAEVRKGSDPITNLDKKAREAVDKTTSEEAKEELVRGPKALDMREGNNIKRKLSKENKASSKGRTRHFLESKTKRSMDIFRPLVAHVFIWLWNAVLYLSILLPILFGLWYREQRIRIGYCGHEEPIKSLAFSAFSQTARVDEFLQAYAPNCLECPEHATCSSLMNIECESGYELKSSILETYGVIPFSKYCVKDESKEKEVDELVWKVSEYLRKKNAQVDCGEGQNLFESGETETKLYEIFSRSRPSWENQADFNEHCRNVIEKLRHMDEIVWLPLDFETGEEIHFKPNNTTCVYRSTSKKWVKLPCHLGADIRKGLRKYGVSVLITLIVILFIKKIQSTLDDYVQGEQIIEQFVKEATDRLKSAKKNEDEEPFLTTVQLRTILLRDIPNIKEQNSLWARTKDKIIKEYSENIELYLLEENGEIMTCLEWND